MTSMTATPTPSRTQWLILGGALTWLTATSANLESRGPWPGDGWRSQHRTIDLHEHIDSTPEHIAQAVRILDRAGVADFLKERFTAALLVSVGAIAVDISYTLLQRRLRQSALVTMLRLGDRVASTKPAAEAASDSTTTLTTTSAATTSSVLAADGSSRDSSGRRQISVRRRSPDRRRRWPDRTGPASGVRYRD